MNEQRVESWIELQELLFADTWNEELGLHRSSLAYRGRADAAQDLGTSLARLRGNARELEVQLMRNFRKYAAADAVPHDTVWDWLALGQHHGLPTRLLDWTYSPYVALHFLTHDPRGFDRDGVVWTIDYVRTHALLPRALRDPLEREGANVFTTELLAETAPAVRTLEELAPEPTALFVEPPSFDARIVNQYALFPGLDGISRWLARYYAPRT